MRIDEIFGPCIAIFKVKNDQEAIEMANDTDYGLGGTVISENPEHAEKVALQIDTGGVYINRVLSS